MSKFSDRAEQFYMEQFNAMFSDEAKKSKEHKEIVEKYSKSNDVELFEDVLKPITEEAINPKKTAPKKKKMIAEEGEGDSDFDFETDTVEEVDPDDEPIEDDDFEGEEEGDSMDEADEILQDIDLENLSNATKLELIRTIIDAAQNLTMEDEEMVFDDFIVELQSIIEEFQYEEEGEGAGEEDVDFGDEGEDVEFEDEGAGDEGAGDDFGTEEEIEEV